MKFYLAIDAEGKKQLRSTQDDIKKVNKTFEVIDVPTDQKSLMALIQESFDKIHELEQVVEFSPTHPSPDAAAEPLPAPAAADPNRKCPRCHSTLKSAEEHCRVFENIYKQEGMEKFILEVADWSMLGMIASSLAYRFERLAKTATPVEKDDGPTAA